MTTQEDLPPVQGSVRVVAMDTLMAPSSDGLTLDAAGAIFNEPTRIDNSWESPYGGPFDEILKPESFARAVRANPKPVMQFDHGTHPMLGSIPVGVINSMRVDGDYLHWSGRVHDNWLTEPVQDAIREGSINGFSWRFTVPEGGESWSDDGLTRTITDLDVPELGPVVWPAYSGAELSLRSREFASALDEDPSLLKDFSIGLLLANHRDEIPDPTTEEEDPARIDAFVVEPAEPDPEVVRVVNPAKRLTTVMAIRTDLATQRSQNATQQLSDR